MISSIYEATISKRKGVLHLLFLGIVPQKGNLAPNLDLDLDLQEDLHPKGVAHGQDLEADLNLDLAADRHIIDLADLTEVHIVADRGALVAADLQEEGGLDRIRSVYLCAILEMR